MAAGLRGGKAISSNLNDRQLDHVNGRRASFSLISRAGRPLTSLFLVRLRGFPSQALSPQSFVVFLESFLRFLIFRYCLSLTSWLKSLSRLSLGWCERRVLTYFVAHRSPPIFNGRGDNDSAAAIRRNETRPVSLMPAARVNSGTNNKKPPKGGSQIQT